MAANRALPGDRFRTSFFDPKVSVSRSSVAAAYLRNQYYQIRCSDFVPIFMFEAVVFKLHIMLISSRCLSCCKQWYDILSLLAMVFALLP